MTTQTMIGHTEYGAAAGNYDGSSQDWFSDAVQAAAYYRGQGSVQTVGFAVTDFEGTVTIESTLDSDPESAAWFDTLVYGNAQSSTTQTISQSIMGNFTWMRARVQHFEAGVINTVTVTY